jgi:hypothetical protein
MLNHAKLFYEGAEKDLIFHNAAAEQAWNEDWFW